MKIRWLPSRTQHRGDVDALLDRRQNEALLFSFSASFCL